MLVHAAADAGVEVREGFTVDEVLIEDGTVVGVRGKDAGGSTVTEHAKVVIGADGRNSSVAKAVQPEQYNEKPAVGPAFYSYWSGVGSSGFEVSIRDRCGMAAFPTHDDLTLVIVGLPEDEFNAARSDVEGTFLRTVDLAPALGERVRSGKREERFHAASDLAGYFRKPYGPGWALVGDAGYHLHPITAQGITDAFLDAERLTDALDAAFAERSTYDDAMAAYQTARDEHVDADVRDDVRLRPGGSAPAARDAAAARCGRRQPAGDGRLRQRPGGDAADPGVLQPREHRPHHGHARRADMTILNAKQEELCHQDTVGLQRPAAPCSSTAR